jgi:16S rRNA processing protein RimM
VDGLIAFKTWWLGRRDEWRPYPVLGARARPRMVIATLEGCANRDEADLLRGCAVAVPRDALPRTADNEFYWADLIGLRVVNGEAQEFGLVVRMLQTGANDVLVVKNGRERLIPFIAEVIRGVDVDAGVITVEWPADY